MEKEPDEILLTTAPVFVDKLKKEEAFAIGFTSGLLSRTLSSPLINFAKSTNFSQFKNEFTKNGIISTLWKGNGQNSISFGAKSAIEFFTYNSLTNKISRKYQLTPSKKTVIGVFSNLISEFVTFPLVSLKTHPLSTSNGIFYALAEVTTDDGLLGLYRRLFPQLLFSIPLASTRYYLKEKISAKSNNTILRSFLPTTISFALTYPTIFIKSMLWKHNETGQFLYTLPEILHNAYEKRGILGVYEGYTKQFLKNVPLLSLQNILIDEMKIAYLNIKNIVIAREMKRKEPLIIEEPIPVKPKFWKWEWF